MCACAPGTAPGAPPGAASWVSAVRVVRRPARAGTSLSVASVWPPCPALCLSTAGFGLGERALGRHCPAWRSLQNNGGNRSGIRESLSGKDQVSGRPGGSVQPCLEVGVCLASELDAGR